MLKFISLRKFGIGCNNVENGDLQGRIFEEELKNNADFTFKVVVGWMTIKAKPPRQLSISILDLGNNANCCNSYDQTYDKGLNSFCKS